MSQSQAAALLRHQEEEDTDKTKQAQIKQTSYRQAPTHWLKYYKEAVIESDARTAMVQLKSKE